MPPELLPARACAVARHTANQKRPAARIEPRDTTWSPLALAHIDRSTTGTLSEVGIASTIAQAAPPPALNSNPHSA